MSEKISNYIFHLKVYVQIFSPMWNEMLTTLVSHLALFFQKSKPSMQLLLMLKTRSKRPKLKTDLSLRIRGVCQDSTLTHEIFDNYYFGSKRLEKHCNPTSNWVYLEMTPIVYCGKKSINAAAKMGICIQKFPKSCPPFDRHFFLNFCFKTNEIKLLIKNIFNTTRKKSLDFFIFKS